MALVHLLHHFVVSLWSAFHERLVLISGEFRQLAQECHDVPKKFIIMRHSPGRHARHLHSVFDDPKFLRRCEATAATEFGRSRIKALSDLGPLHAGSKMAATAHLSVL